MPPKPKSITTAADRLYELVKRENEVSFKDAAKELKVPIGTIEAWASFLEEDGLLSVKYKLTTPYLTSRVPVKKKEKKPEPLPVFQNKLAEMEMKTEMESAHELLGTAVESRSRGEFRVLERITDEIISKLKKIIDTLTSKLGLSPQAKTELIDELDSIEKKATDNAELLKNNRFDEASTAYSALHKSIQNMLKKAEQRYTEEKEETSADESNMKALLEKTYSLLQEGKLEEAEDNYERIKKMFGVFSQKFVSEKSEMQGSILKLNRDLSVYADRIKDARLKGGTESISKLLKLANQSIKQKKFLEATALYLQIKKIFESLPHGFIKEKRHLKEEILKIFGKVAKEREERLHSRFNLMSGQIKEHLKVIRGQLEEGSLKDALAAYRTAGQVYSGLPHGFMKEKLNLQNRLIEVYNRLSEKIESTTESDMRVKEEKLLAMLAEFKRRTEQNEFDAAENAYSEINSLFKQLPVGFLKRKTELQEKIIGQYEKLLERRDSTNTTVFKNAAESLENMIRSAYAAIQHGNYPGASELYRQIKDAYVRLQPIEPVHRRALRDKILMLYRRILMQGPQAAYKSGGAPLEAGAHAAIQDVHKKISELKSQSKAQVRIPA